MGLNLGQSPGHSPEQFIGGPPDPVAAKSTSTPVQGGAAEPASGIAAASMSPGRPGTGVGQEWFADSGTYGTLPEDEEVFEEEPRSKVFLFAAIGLGLAAAAVAAVLLLKGDSKSSALDPQASESQPAGAAKTTSADDQPDSKTPVTTNATEDEPDPVEAAETTTDTPPEPAGAGAADAAVAAPVTAAKESLEKVATEAAAKPNPGGDNPTAPPSAGSSQASARTLPAVQPGAADVRAKADPPKAVGPRSGDRRATRDEAAKAASDRDKETNGKSNRRNGKKKVGDGMLPPDF